MSSPYVVLGGRPLNEWLVADLKEELERRNLSTNGLEVDLVMRLDEDVRAEEEKSAKVNVDYGLSSTNQLESSPEKESIQPVGSEKESIQYVVSENESIQMDDRMDLPIGGNGDIIDDVRKLDIPGEKEKNFVNVVNVEPVDTEAHKDTLPALSSDKRKSDIEAVGNDDSTKRIRLSNAEEDPKSSEPESGVVVGSTTPNDSSPPTFKSFSRSNSLVNEETIKERVVPPPSHPPTNSLRIDGFVRPLALKALQKLLEETGTVVSFWMDTIKTHCYVCYSSVEEAVDTCNAVYNLQWPAKWGGLLVVEFVDPQEVKNHVEGVRGLSLTHSSNGIPTSSTQSTSREQVSRQLLSPPPPHSPHRVTINDLFLRTETRPWIYYLPLTDEEVAAKKLQLKGNDDEY